MQPRTKRYCTPEKMMCSAFLLTGSRGTSRWKADLLAERPELVSGRSAKMSTVFQLNFTGDPAIAPRGLSAADSDDGEEERQGVRPAPPHALGEQRGGVGGGPAAAGGSGSGAAAERGIHLALQEPEDFPGGERGVRDADAEGGGEHLGLREEEGSRHDEERTVKWTVLTEGISRGRLPHAPELDSPCP